MLRKACCAPVLHAARPPSRTLSSYVDAGLPEYMLRATRTRARLTHARTHASAAQVHVRLRASVCVCVRASGRLDQSMRHILAQ